MGGFLCGRTLELFDPISSKKVHAFKFFLVIQFHNIIFYFIISEPEFREYTDRQTDILLTEKKSHYRLICHRNERDICTCIYKIVTLLKSYDNIHGMTYTAKIMLSGIAKIKTGYFDNINDYY